MEAVVSLQRSGVLPDEPLQKAKLMLPADWRALALTQQGMSRASAERLLLPRRGRGSRFVAC